MWEVYQKCPEKFFGHGPKSRTEDIVHLTPSIFRVPNPWGQPYQPQMCGCSDCVVFGAVSIRCSVLKQPFELLSSQNHQGKRRKISWMLDHQLFQMTIYMLVSICWILPWRDPTPNLPTGSESLFGACQLYQIAPHILNRTVVSTIGHESCWVMSRIWRSRRRFYISVNHSIIVVPNDFTHTYFLRSCHAPPWSVPLPDWEAVAKKLPVRWA